MMASGLPPVIASQWDWDKLRYDYFRLPGTVSLGGWGKLGGLGITGVGSSEGVGVDIESVLPVLPAGAVRIGSGVQAVGRIVQPSRRPQYESRQPAGFGALSVQQFLPPEAKAVLDSSELRTLKDRVGLHTAGAFVLGMAVGYLLPKAKWVLLGTAAIATLVTGFGAGKEAR